eukprot:TRINITY_DN14708_c0_g1_i2.p1 TRINITY_DN14708_c0_g1~~TRINITY_DN14708_c0_g1_i2.p1  ORF type:complete len:225 (-),score=55.46 TRINITY_DN14708_c0_g1_i2:684-1358(-)
MKPNFEAHVCRLTGGRWNKMGLREEVAALDSKLRSTRRELHAHPEIGLQEVKTCEFIAKRLREIGVDEVIIGCGETTTAVIGIIQGDRSGPCIALRADMDALPIQEDAKVPYTSNNKGVMHACGHDGHMAMLLIAAEVIVSMKHRLHGSVKLLFQPGEEGFLGAKKMIEGNCLENPHVDQVYGIHLWSYIKPGVVGVKQGPLMAAAHFFNIEIKGKGGHGAAPQ